MANTSTTTVSTTPVVSNKFLQMIKERRTKSVPNLSTPTFHNSVASENILIKKNSPHPKHYSHAAPEKAENLNYCKQKSFMKKKYYIPKATPPPKTKNPATKGSIFKNGFEVHPDSVFRSIVIDGSNVAMQHGNRKFSWRGLELIVDYFLQRGHTDINVILPKNKEGAFKQSVEDFKIATRLIRSGAMVWVPSRQPIDGQRMNPYDDRFIINIAILKKAVIVSNDQYRDLMSENKEWKEYIRDNLLMFTVVDDHILFPSDPLGRDGPSLDDFLLLKKKDKVFWNMMKKK